jgi:hypothetical protein
MFIYFSHLSPHAFLLFKINFLVLSLHWMKVNIFVWVDVIVMLNCVSGFEAGCGQNISIAKFLVPDGGIQSTME